MERASVSVLLVEDSATYAQMTRAVLARDGAFRVEHVTSLAAAHDRLRRGGIDLVLLDLTLPDAEGFATYLSIAATAPDVPIVIFSGAEDEALAIQAVQEGAQDYLCKRAEDVGSLARSLRYAIERHRMQMQLRALALIDEMTGLYNRRGFVSVAQHDLGRAFRLGREVSLVFADLDGLKDINDRLGHAAGDQAITDAANVLRAAFRSSDVIGRLGGDEFAVLASVGDDAEPRIGSALDEFNASSRRTYTLAMSVGVAAPADGEARLEDLLERADSAMYNAKRQRRVVRAS